MADRHTPYKDGEHLPFKLAASAAVETGKLAALNATGFAVEAADVAGLTVVGIFTEAVDNTNGGDGDRSALVRRKKAFKLKNSAVAPVIQAAVGANVFVQDSETVALAAGPTNDVVAGRCLGLETDGVWVEIG